MLTHSTEFLVFNPKKANLAIAHYINSLTPESYRGQGSWSVPTQNIVGKRHCRVLISNNSDAIGFDIIDISRIKVKKQRSPGLIAIVLYKSFVASLLTVTSIGLLLALKNHQVLENFSASFFLETKLNIIELLLDKVLIVKPQTLLFSGLAAGLYAVLTAVEAVGLWYEKGWATILVLVLVGISIPPEVYELVQGVTVLKLGAFIANVAVLWYLLHHLPKHGKGS